MQSKEFEVGVITPMFLSGQDLKIVEMRPPSIKGQLRWWWRALNGHLEINTLKRKESDIFGSTEQRSSFSLITKPLNNFKTEFSNLPPGTKIEVTSKGKTFPVSLIEYLAFGVAEYQKGKGNVYRRPHIVPDSKFIVKFNFRDSSYKNEIITAFKYLIKYGGLGAKNRNGFGSISIQEDLDVDINTTNHRTSYTSISKDSVQFIFGMHNKWVDALAEVGRIYREARTGLELRHTVEKRRLIATPIIAKNEYSINDRHAKSYFLHITKINNKYRGEILFLPYNYHKQDKQNAYNEVGSKMCAYFEQRAKHTIYANQ